MPLQTCGEFALQVFNCPLSTMALHNNAKAHMGGMPMPDIVGGKHGWHTDPIFAVGKKGGELQPSQQYDHIKKTGVMSHLNRHVLPCKQESSTRSPLQRWQWQ